MDRLATFRREALVHLAELRRVAARLAPDPSAADDLAQETFLQAWRRFDSFTPGTNCRAWLYRILFLVAQGQKRQAKPLFAIDDVPESALAIEGSLPDVFGRDHVRAAFDSLARDQQVVVQLADVEGLRYREIAEALDLPLGTVMSRLSRARSLLRQRVAERLATKEVAS